MITHIRMKNFKSWEDSKYIKLGSLSGFFGANNSGKSSLFQMLLLLKQTTEYSDNEEIIFFGDNTSYVNLGNFREVIHGHKLVDPLCFEFECKQTHSQSLFKIPEDGSGWEQKIVQFAYEGIFRHDKGQLIVEKLSYGPSLGGVAEIVCNEGKISFPRRNSVERSIQLKNCYGMCSSGEVESINLLQKYITAFEDMFSHVFYLGPIRAHPQRNYHWEGSHHKDIGKFGEKTINALLSARIDRKTIQYEEEEKSIEERISDWLREMDLAYTFLLERNETSNGKDYEIRIQQKAYGPKIAFTDMGYGLSQFLPVLVLCYYAPEGSTLILEQPGIHLHPKLQSQLADLLIEVVNERNLQVLVESHSEHLLTRLQLRIAEEKISNDQTALYFCQNENGTSNIIPLKLDEFGNISNWPENFFGDEMGDLFAMTEAQRERQKRVECE
ncbi:MAG: DUF3696 domain-containing protein [Candidatus Poribacteria bacterium]|nr:DUF3696 domain-containing protein [Candidatus Poribacteria bacterium]